MEQNSRLYLIVPIVVAVVFVIVELTFGLNFGIFRDEMYFIQCGENLDFGYVDQPPMIALIARLSTTLFGYSLLGLRLWPALLGAATVLMTAAIARELGGGRFAQGLAATAILAAPYFAGSSGTLCISSIEISIWTAAFWVAVKILKGGPSWLWLLFGAIAGLGLETKVSGLVFGFAVVAGLLLTRQRRQLAIPCPYVGGAIALVLFLPHVIWQMLNGWPTLEFMARAMANKNFPLSPLEFVMQVWQALNPFTIILWLPGLLFLLLGKDRDKFRALGYACLIAAAVFVLQRSKFYYVMPVVPLMMAAGAVAWERFTSTGGWRAWLKPAVVVVLLLSGAAFIPLAVPVLAPEALIDYSAMIGLGEIRTERHERVALPQYFADRFGWRELAEATAKVYNALSPEEQRKCAIFTTNYGEAGAIDYFGRELGLPRALSSHNSYWLWGPRGHTGEVMIFIRFDPGDFDDVFESVEVAAVHDHRYAMAYQRNVNILLCRNPNVTLKRLWPDLKHYD